MAVEHYQNVVIGSGEAGKILAWNLAKQGQKTVVVERSMVGGSCPNIACLPSKNVIYSAKAVSLVDPQRGLGVVTGQLRVNMAGVAQRKRQMVDGLMELHHGYFRASGAELVMGEARFTEPKTLEVALNAGGARLIRGERVFLNVGSRASIPAVPGLSVAAPMTHVEALNLETLPEHLMILGGGYVGVEFAQAMRRLGSRVTIVQRGQQLVEREDADVASALLEILRQEGVEVLLGTEVSHVAGHSGDEVTLLVREGGSEKTLAGTHLLVAAGRTPNTDRLNADKGGVRLDPRGYIAVNEKLQTTAPDVWAMGDGAGSPQFTHVGFDDFRVVLSNLTGGNRTTRDRLIPYCLFTDPELAHVGLTESEAKSRGTSYRLAKLPMSLVLRTRTLSETRGFAKVLVGDDDRILGFTALGAEASEMMAVVQTAILGRMPYTELRDAIFTHPTAAEGLIALFSGVPGKAASN
jgi:pyruvate/2-oxoglutarate dehydrogenase complex dihydrolipoamide dehydrogenase (E3) component